MHIQRVEQSNAHFTINSLVYTPDASKDRGLTVLMGHGFSVSKHHLDGLASYLCYFGYEVVNSLPCPLRWGWRPVRPCVVCYPIGMLNTSA